MMKSRGPSTEPLGTPHDNSRYRRSTDRRHATYHDNNRTLQFARMQMNMNIDNSKIMTKFCRKFKFLIFQVSVAKCLS